MYRLHFDGAASVQVGSDLFAQFGDQSIGKVVLAAPRPAAARNPSRSCRQQRRGWRAAPRRTRWRPRRYGHALPYSLG